MNLLEKSFSWRTFPDLTRRFSPSATPFYNSPQKVLGFPRAYRGEELRKFKKLCGNLG
jgi:hypothetical protein